MIDKELISIITPVYNASKFISDTIESVLEQTYENWELILVDDCSTDDSIEIMNNFKDSRVKVLKAEKNGGAARARNIAIQHAKGDYISFLDSDDTFEPSKLEKQLMFMKNNNLAFSFTSYKIIEKDSSSIVVNVPQYIDYDGFLRNTIIGTSTVMLNKKLINNVLLVDVRQDHDSMTWLRIMRENNISAYGLNKTLTNYYKRTGSISDDKFKAAYIHFKNLREIEKLSLFKTINVFAQYSIRAFLKHYAPRKEKDE